MELLQQKISIVRRAIRLYIVLESLAIIATGAAVFLMVTVAIDFLPVRLGMTELPWIIRLLLLMSAATLFCYFAYQLLLARLLRPLSDKNICLLIERRYPVFSDALITRVSTEPSQTKNAVGRRMIEATERSLKQNLPSVRVSNLLDVNRLKNLSLMATVALAGLIVIGWFAPTVAATGMDRILFLAGNLYPRQTKILSVELQSESNIETNPYFQSSLKLKNGHGNTVNRHDEFFVVASVESSGKNFNRNSTCSLIYEKENGPTGTIAMHPVRQTTAGKIYTSSQKLLFDRNTRVWIRSFDVTQGPFQIAVESPPAIGAITRKIQFPKYLRDASEFWRDQTEILRIEESVPVGSKVQFRVPVLNSGIQTASLISLNGDATELSIGNDGDLVWSTEVGMAGVSAQLYFRTADGRTNSEPVFISMKSIQDRLPEIQAQFTGVGEKITANAILPVTLQLKDDYGLQSAGYEIKVENKNVLKRKPFEPSKNRVQIDLDAESKVGPESDPQWVPGDVLTVRFFAADHHPAHAKSWTDAKQFTVVSEADFIQVITELEANNRRRLEGVSRDFRRTEAMLSILRRRIDGQGTEPVDDQWWKNDGVALMKRIDLQSSRSQLEIESSLVIIENLISQLKNNRVSNVQKKNKLQKSVLLPLNQLLISLKAFTAKGDHIVDSWEKAEPSQLKRQILNSNVEQLSKLQQRISIVLDQIVQQLEKFETQNEILDSVRSLIDQQTELIKETETLKNEKAFNDLFKLP